MRKTSKRHLEPDMLPEYDFSRSTRGKYARRCARGTNVVVLDPDVAGFFSDSKSVNEALRALAGISRKVSRKSRAHG